VQHCSHTAVVLCYILCHTLQLAQQHRNALGVYGAALARNDGAYDVSVIQKILQQRMYSDKTAETDDNGDVSSDVTDDVVLLKRWAIAVPFVVKLLQQWGSELVTLHNVKLVLKHYSKHCVQRRDATGVAMLHYAQQQLQTAVQPCSNSSSSTHTTTGHIAQTSGSSVLHKWQELLFYSSQLSLYMLQQVCYMESRLLS
jgi:hypothetical protein